MGFIVALLVIFDMEVKRKCDATINLTAARDMFRVGSNGSPRLLPESPSTVCRGIISEVQMGGLCLSKKKIPNQRFNQNNGIGYSTCVKDLHLVWHLPEGKKNPSTRANVPRNVYSQLSQDLSRNMSITLNQGTHLDPRKPFICSCGILLCPMRQGSWRISVARHHQSN
jgi:hypothetical protein